MRKGKARLNIARLTPLKVYIIFNNATSETEDNKHNSNSAPT